MFIKVTKSGSRRYVQLVESYRDDSGTPRQRTVATVGRLGESGGSVDSLLNGLLKATGRLADTSPSSSPSSSPEVRFEPTLALGDVWALDQLWRELGFDALG